MKFSFVTCTYNRDKYVGQTLSSICEQDYDVNDFESIVVDNNSTDNTSKVCDEIIKKYADKQVKYVKEINQGLSFALNRGIKEAKGEYIIFVDDDETINVDYLSKLATYLLEYSHVVLAGTPVIPVYESKEPKWMSHFTKRLISGYYYQGESIKKLEAKNYPGTGHTIIKKELFEKFGYYNTDLGRKGGSLMGAEDKDMFFRLRSNNVECYYFPDIPIYHHIPSYKLTNEFFERLTYSIGKSERIRTKSISDKAYQRRIFDEMVKWAATMFLFFVYVICLTPSKGIRLIKFRKNVTKGLLGK